MIYNYEFTELAINDIDETLNYITNNLCNKKAAVDLMKDIEKAFIIFVCFHWHILIVNIIILKMKILDMLLLTITFYFLRFMKRR